MYSDIRSKSSNCDQYSLSDVKLLQHGARLAVLAEELEFGITYMEMQKKEIMCNEKRVAAQMQNRTGTTSFPTRNTGTQVQVQVVLNLESSSDGESYRLLFYRCFVRQKMTYIWLSF